MTHLQFYICFLLPYVRTLMQEVCRLQMKDVLWLEARASRLEPMGASRVRLAVVMALACTTVLASSISVPTAIGAKVC